LNNIKGLSGIMWKTSRKACLVMWSYTLVVTFITRFLFGRRAEQLEAQKQASDANFSSALTRVGDAAEGIAFYRAGPQEEQRMFRVFARLLRAENVQLQWLGLFGTVEGIFNWVSSILPSLIMAPLIWDGYAEMKDYMLMIQAFNTVKGSLFFLADNYDTVSAMTAQVHRVKKLFYFHADTAAAQKLVGEIGFRPSQDNALLTLENVRVAIPLKDCVACKWLGSADGVSFRLEARSSVLIKGESGVGKSSLLRAIAGIWHDGSGNIRRTTECYFLPQSPYLPSGEDGVETSLQEQLLYPDSSVRDDKVLRDALRVVGLGVLAETDLSLKEDWITKLSGGEKQRLVFARLLVQLSHAKKPLVLLDEATSACSEEMEAQLYKVLSARLQGAPEGFGLVSVGHRSTLNQFHTCVLSLDAP